MYRTTTVITLFALADCAYSATIRGRVVDRAGKGARQARVIAGHDVPIIEIYDHKHPPWNGLLGQTYADGGGYFTLQTSNRAYIDYIVASRGKFVGGVRPPFPQRIRISLHPTVDIIERLRRARERGLRLRQKHRPTPNQAMQRTPKAFGVTDLESR
jgi:hypothetical protein